jgi:virginiamycin B lyase
MYPVPGVRFGVSGITTGPDRTLWFTADNSIWRLTLTGVMTEFRLPDDGVFYPMGRGAASITSGPDGALWFTEVTANKIGRITTAGMIREFPLYGDGRSPRKIATGPDGALWFTELIGTQGRIARITIDGAISEYRLSACPGNCGRYPFGITVGPDGALWFTDIGDSGIHSITTTGQVTDYGGVGLYGVQPGDIIIGPDDALWFTGADTAGPHDHLGRITAAGIITAFPLPIYPRPTYNGYNNIGPNSITTGPDRALWFTSGRVNIIGRMTAEGSVTLYTLPPTALDDDTGRSSCITLGPDRALWIGAPGFVIRASVQIDATPPLITVRAEPHVLWPPNGKLVQVTVSGRVTDVGSGVLASSVEYAVRDEYRLIQPSGHLVLSSTGTYSFTVLLRASREGSDKDGRRYEIRVGARDNAGNHGVESVDVIVPHDRR